MQQQQQQQHLWPRSIINMYRAQQPFHFMRLAQQQLPMAASGACRIKQVITYVSTARESDVKLKTSFGCCCCCC